MKERCQDGCGVFPGNYVMSLRKNSVPSQKNISETSIADDAVKHNKICPPELPPRSSGSSSSMWSKPIGQHVEALFGNKFKKFTNAKRSKSPVKTYSMDNPVFEDNSGGFKNHIGTSKRKTATCAMQPTHIRSGSCPSKLTQNESIRKVEAFRSHRVRPPKERSSLQTVTNINTESSYHRKSHSLDAASIAAQIPCASSRKTYTNNERLTLILLFGI